MLLRTQNNKIFLYGTLHRGDAVLFDEAFSVLQESRSDIELHLHTCGGSVFEGNMIYNTLLSASSRVSVYIDGLAASMGAIIMLGGEKIYMAENAFLMIHAPAGQTFGTASDHIKAANLLTEMEDIFIKRFCEKTGKEAAGVKKWLEGDNWFSTSQALKEGLIDEIAPPAVKVEIREKDLATPQGVFDRFAALLQESPQGDDKRSNPDQTPFESHLNQPIFFAMKQKMIEAFGLELQENSSDTAFIQAMEERINRYKNLYESEKADAEKLKEDIEQEKKNKVTALLDRAVKEGKISAAQKALYKEVGEKNGAATLERLFETLPHREPLTARMKPEAFQNRHEWDWDKYQKEDPEALERIEKEDPQGFKTLYEAKYKK